MNLFQEKIYNSILEDILKGRLPLGSKLPTETALSKTHCTNRMNAHFAIKKLEEHGILWRNKRQGTFVGKIPNTLRIGELKCVNTRRVCILNTCNNAIHWNERIVSAFNKGIEGANIEPIYRDGTELTTYDELLSYIKRIATEGYNAILVVSETFTDSIIKDHPELLFKFHNNVFIFNRGTSVFSDWPFNVVSLNMFGEGVLAAEYLIEKGYEKVVYFAPNMKLYWAKERCRGLEFGLIRETDGKVSLLKMGYDYHNPDFDIRGLVSGQKTALVASNDRGAAKLLEYSKEKGLKAGKDFGLMGFDDNSIFRGENITTITPPLEEIGLELATQITNSLDGKNTNKIISISISSKVTPRETC